MTFMTYVAMLENLFDDLEATHGKVLVSHVIAYLSAARFGLSEPEILDILSTDDQVCALLLLVVNHSRQKVTHSVLTLSCRFLLRLMSWTSTVFI